MLIPPSQQPDPQPTPSGLMRKGAEIDCIVLGSTARALLGKYGILPSMWRLPDEEPERIIGAKVLVTVVLSPACQIALSPNPLMRLPKAYVVAIDLNYLEAGRLSPRECVALILHEIGHIVNEPRREPAAASTDELAARFANRAAAKENIEFLADDYARHCGYGTEIASSLEKLIVSDPQKFDNVAARERIERIRRETAPVLHLQAVPRQER